MEKLQEYDNSRPRNALAELQANMGYEFTDPELLELALTHASWANEHGRENYHNQRLEFLGDAVLELCVAHELYRRYPDAREGPMTEMRSDMVSEAPLAAMAREIGIARALRLGRGEERQGGRARDSLLADAFEALIAAVYEDGGFHAARRVVAHLFAPHWPAQAVTAKQQDPKTQLQEACQKLFRENPAYRLLQTSGPEHEKTFAMALTLPDGREFRASESSCKKAEQSAAALALAALGLR